MTRPGRKAGPQGARTARLVVRVTPADVEAYKAAAGRAGVSMGEWVRGRLSAALPTPEIRSRPYRITHPTGTLVYSEASADAAIHGAARYLSMDASDLTATPATHADLGILTAPPDDRLGAAPRALARRERVGRRRQPHRKQ